MIGVPPVPDERKGFSSMQPISGVLGDRHGPEPLRPMSCQCGFLRYYIYLYQRNSGSEGVPIFSPTCACLGSYNCRLLPKMRWSPPSQASAAIGFGVQIRPCPPACSGPHQPQLTDPKNGK